MSKKFYGSLNNRFDEGQMFVKKIEVGTGVTEYGYSDRHPYEVVEVVNQKHIFIRAMESKRIDNNGMSDCQEYEYIRNTNNPKIELVLRNNVWFKVVEYNKDLFLRRAENIKDDFKDHNINKAYSYVRYMAHLTEDQYKRIDEGKTVKKYTKMNISFGIMQEYFDYSF